MTDNQEEPKTIVYISVKYPELTVVYKKDTTTIIDGSIVKEPVQYIRFLPSPFGGKFETNDKGKQDKIESLPGYKSGEIVRMGDKMKLSPSVSSHNVVRGSLSSRPGSSNKVKPPEEVTPAPPAAAKGPMVDPEPVPEPEVSQEKEPVGGGEKKLF